MTFLVIVFRSRNETLYMANILKNGGINVSIVNTPKEAGQACGISVRVEKRYVSTVKNILSAKPFRSFHGCYRITNVSYGRMTVEKLF